MIFYKRVERFSVEIWIIDQNGDLNLERKKNSTTYRSYTHY